MAQVQAVLKLLADHSERRITRRSFLDEIETLTAGRAETAIEIPEVLEQIFALLCSAEDSIQKRAGDVLVNLGKASSDVQKIIHSHFLQKPEGNVLDMREIPDDPEAAFEWFSDNIIKQYPGRIESIKLLKRWTAEISAHTKAAIFACLSNAGFWGPFDDGQHQTFLAL